MKKISKAIKAFFRVKYRVSIQYNGDTEPRHAYYLDLKLTRNLVKAAGKVPYWCIYRTGPFLLPERPIDCSTWHEKGGVQ